MGAGSLSGLKRYSAFGAPIVEANSIGYRTIVYSRFTRPIAQKLRFPKSLYVPIAGPISWLKNLRHPVTILRAIIFAVVTPLNRELALWPIPHVFIKVFKTLPAIAKADAFPPVFRKMNVARVFASLFDRKPSFVFDSLRHAVSLPSRTSALSFEAATTFSIPGFQAVGTYAAFGSADTPAPPDRTASFVRLMRADNGPSTKLIAWGYDLLSHKRAPYTVVVRSPWGSSHPCGLCYVELV